MKGLYQTTQPRVDLNRSYDFLTQNSSTSQQQLIKSSRNIENLLEKLRTNQKSRQLQFSTTKNQDANKINKTFMEQDLDNYNLLQNQENKVKKLTSRNLQPLDISKSYNFKTRDKQSVSNIDQKSIVSHASIYRVKLLNNQ